MQMTDEQAWEDMSRFALAMKRGATVVMNDSVKLATSIYRPDGVDFDFITDHRGIREIIEPPQKNVRPLNAEEWKDVAGCVYLNRYAMQPQCVPPSFNSSFASDVAAQGATCHPPGFPGVIRKLWVEE